MNTKPPAKIELLQALRAVAALAVVFFHTGYQPGYGAYGVSVFFVLSGIIMAMLFEAGESPGQFIQRRLIRIVPLYWCMTTLMAAIILRSPERTTSGATVAQEYFLSLFFIPFRANNGAMVPILGPGWTINYEIAFYVSCALGLFLGRSRPLISTALLVVSWWCIARNFDSLAGEFYGNAVVLYFVAGMGLWQLSRLSLIRFKTQMSLLFILLACAILAYLEFLSNNHKNLYFSAQIKVVLVISIAAVSLFSEQAFQRVPEVIRSVFIEVGDASYAIYLSHLFVIHAILIAGRRLGINESSLSLALVSVFASVAIGFLIHQYFDGPIQKKLRNYFRPQPTVR